MATLNNIDEEWKKFILSKNNYNDDDDEYNDDDPFECENFDSNYISANINENLNNEEILEKDIPKSSEIYISTKTKIAYLNNSINLKDMFWYVPILKYMEPKNGVIKKQMKFNSLTEIELQDIKERLQHES